MENNEEKSPKERRNLLAVVCFFTGYFGIHRFMTGKYVSGLIQFFTCGGFFVWQLIDFVMILTGNFTDKDGVPLKEKIEKYKEEHPEECEENTEREVNVSLSKWFLLIELPWILLVLGVVITALCVNLNPENYVVESIGISVSFVGSIAILCTIPFKRKIRNEKGKEKTKNPYTWFISYTGKIIGGTVCIAGIIAVFISIILIKLAPKDTYFCTYCGEQHMGTLSSIKMSSRNICPYSPTGNHEWKKKAT